ncbi:MAG: hypothetical protein ACRYFU_11590 [Janthinobacterium lividum]
MQVRGLLPTLAQQKSKPKIVTIAKICTRSEPTMPAAGWKEFDLDIGQKRHLPANCGGATYPGLTSISSSRLHEHSRVNTLCSAVKFRDPQLAGNILRIGVENFRSQLEKSPQLNGSESAADWNIAPQLSGKAPQLAGNIPAAGWKFVPSKLCILLYLATT